MAGHISIFFTSHCGICTQTFTSSEDGLPNFRRYLREKGWKNTRKHSWKCPACQKSEVVETALAKVCDGKGHPARPHSVTNAIVDISEKSFESQVPDLQHLDIPRHSP